MSTESAAQSWPGRSLGLPESGVSSVATQGSRFGAFFIDILLAAGAGWAFTAPEPPQNVSLIIWAVMTVLTVGILGFTPGQAIVGIRVAPLNRTYVGLWAVPRTLLIFLVIPALISNSDGRGLHDRACRTVVIRMR